MLRLPLANNMEAGITRILYYMYYNILYDMRKSHLKAKITKPKKSHPIVLEPVTKTYAKPNQTKPGLQQRRMQKVLKGWVKLVLKTDIIHCSSKGNILLSSGLDYWMALDVVVYVYTIVVDYDDDVVDDDSEWSHTRRVVTVSTVSKQKIRRRIIPINSVYKYGCNIMYLNTCNLQASAVAAF